MKTLSNNDVILMENLVGIGQKALQDVLYKFLKQNYKNVTYDEDFLLAKGNIPIALVAHMDTVFKQPAKEVFYDRIKNVMWSPTGMGADDRAGVFGIIKIIKAGYRPHIIFTTDEEIGCVGANELSYLPCPFEDLKYIIQLDRRGSNDCVFYDCDNKEFEEYVEKFGFVTAYGSFTDICELCPSWGVAGVNLSIGYRDEHTTSEILFVGQMLDTIEKVKKMLSEKNIPEFKFVPSVGYYRWNYYPGYWEDDYEEYYGLTPTYPKSVTGVRYKCSGCGTICTEDDVLPVKLIKGGKGFFCSQCLERKVDWCTMCGEPYEINKSNICPDCEKKFKKNKK